mmetsp:Transcript_9463/g.17846  ORF Transcript_9463/g.17846 Transcript_9463/m.17846 type:complete len:488 (+) Transcript_9463:4957-6420(+)
MGRILGLIGGLIGLELVEASLVVLEPQSLKGITLTCYPVAEDVGLGYYENFNWTLPIHGFNKSYCPKAHVEEGSLRMHWYSSNYQPKPELEEQHCGNISNLHKVVVHIRGDTTEGSWLYNYAEDNQTLKDEFLGRAWLNCDSIGKGGDVEKLLNAHNNGTFIRVRVSADPNPFEKTFGNILYHIHFRGIYATLFAICAFASVKFTHERFQSSNKVHFKSLQTCVLLIDGSTCALLAYCLAFDAWFAQRHGLSKDTRFRLLTILSGVSLCTTFLVTIVWYKLKFAVFKIGKNKSQNGWSKAGMILCTLLAAFALLLDVFHGVLLSDQMVGPMYGGAMLILCVVFLKEARFAASNILEVSTMIQGVSTKSAQLKCDLAAQAESMKYWIRLSALFMLCFVIVSTLIGVTNVLHRPHTWWIIYGCAMFCRILISWTHLIMCRMPTRLLDRQKSSSNSIAPTISSPSSGKKLGSAQLPATSLPSTTRSSVGI